MAYEKLKRDMKKMTGVGAPTADNIITNKLVKEGKLPESQKETFPQRVTNTLPLLVVPGVRSKVDTGSAGSLSKKAKNVSGKIVSTIVDKAYENKTKNRQYDMVRNNLSRKGGSELPPYERTSSNIEAERDTKAKTFLSKIDYKQKKNNYMSSLLDKYRKDKNVTEITVKPKK